MSEMSDQTQDPPILDRKVSTYSETDSGVDVDNDTEEGVELGLEKRVIKPDLDIISKLCNFDEEEEVEGEMTESDSDTIDSSDDDSPSENTRVSLTLTELRHILSALVRQHTEVTSNIHHQSMNILTLNSLKMESNYSVPSQDHYQNITF